MATQYTGNVTSTNIHVGDITCTCTFINNACMYNNYLYMYMYVQLISFLMCTTTILYMCE